MDNLICVDLALNDDNGRNSGWCEAVQIGSAFGDGPFASLEGDPIRCEFRGKTLHFDTLILPMHGYIPWHGNMCWDAVRLTMGDAISLLNLLRVNHWTMTEADSELFNAYESGAEFLISEVSS